MRADAAKNRMRILEAAIAAFSREGTAVPVDEIARRAGVGPGTVHRHFPTKASLVQEVVAASIEHLARGTQDSPGSADPVTAFFDLLRRMVTEGTGNLALVESLHPTDLGPAIAAAKAELTEVLGRLLRAAQAAGGVRGDVRAADVHALVVACIHAVRALPEQAPGDRVVGVVLDGLRAYAVR